MIDPRYNKFYVAVAGAFVSVALRIIATRYGLDLSVYEADIVQGVGAIVTAALVYAVPNAEPEKPEWPSSDS